ncbi:MAG: DegT/DnrJ/EryC1/StrS family aminotransferase [Bacteroidales bacterium]|nr:DegT/DnrJ/EryC1/StrS family aminotransferase [Bacteroidales bacterium]
MSCALEIGGNFSLTEQRLCEAKGSVDWILPSLSAWESVVPTSSGRGAIALLVNNLTRVQRVLLPVYTCDSIIQPFRNRHISYDFYQINPDLSPDESSLLEMISKVQPDLVFFQSYYGFATLDKIRPLFPKIREKGIIVVEDITHSLLDEVHNEDVDYAVVSYRKWLEIPDGGAVLSKKHSLLAGEQRPQEEKVLSLFKNASQLKSQYLNNGDETLKNIFRPMFYEIEDIYNAEISPAQMSDLTKNILASAHWDDIKHTRRRNFQILKENIDNKRVFPVFKDLPQGIVPLYFPVFVPEQRNSLQKHLANHKIYCPIHWPIPEEITPHLTEQSRNVYGNVLSIVCDQRYSEDDMMRIVEVINQFE